MAFSSRQQLQSQCAFIYSVYVAGQYWTKNVALHTEEQLRKESQNTFCCCTAAVEHGVASIALR